MRTTLLSPACCDYGPAVPEQYSCMWKDIKREYTRLYCRYKKMVTNKRRICELAEPRTRKRRFEKACRCPDRGLRKVSIVRMEEPKHTRLEQLSYPPVRSLSLLRTHPSYQNFSMGRRSSINRLIHNSLFSLYSRLSNTQPPDEEQLPKKWTKEELTKHRKRLDKLSKPRKDPSTLEAEKKKRSAEALKQEKVRKRGKGPKCCGRGGRRFSYHPAKPVSLTRIHRLAKPRKYPDLTRPPWKLTPRLAKYVPSRRVLQIARPVRIRVKEDPEQPYRVQESALTYKISPRVKFLSMPVKINTRNTVVEQLRNQVSPAALKFKTKQRYIELSEPRMFDDNHTRKDPYKVSPKALKAKTTKRIIELSQPRKYGLGLTRT